MQSLLYLKEDLTNIKCHTGFLYRNVNFLQLIDDSTICHMDILAILVQVKSIQNRIASFIHLRIALSVPPVPWIDNNALLIYCSDKNSALSTKRTLHALHRAVIPSPGSVPDHNYTTDICLNKKLLRSVKYQQKKIIKKKILDKAVLVKTLLCTLQIRFWIWKAASLPTICWHPRHLHGLPGRIPTDNHHRP